MRDLELKAEQEKALLEAEKEAAVREHELKMAGLGKHMLNLRGKKRTYSIDGVILRSQVKTLKS